MPAPKTNGSIEEVASRLPSSPQHLGPVGMAMSITVLNDWWVRVPGNQRRQIFEAFSDEGVHVFGDPCYQPCDGGKNCPQKVGYPETPKQ
jgi:hypothetical protein